MAKKNSLGTFIALLLGQLAIGGYKSYKKRKAELQSEYRDLLDQRLEELAPELEAYEKDVRSLPELTGNHRFTIDVDLTYADTEALGHFTTYLEVTHNVGKPVATVLIAVPSKGGKGQVRVELSQAFMGTLNDEFAARLCDFIESLGGRATCSAKLTGKNEKYSLMLDLAEPFVVQSESE